ncbi:hypothetical protein [Haladaptatus sp. W1]|uniref:DUF7118 family protein n=1 Tax=Haladaptatus sp. W1 TaxID=1897478 RepID=UPI000A740426|nr:hypothetical protein [Haladaptatus sp. W1]
MPSPRTRRTSTVSVPNRSPSTGRPPPRTNSAGGATRRFASRDRFAPPEAITRLREVERLTRDDDFERLRTAARARSELSDEERDRLARGDVTDELERAQERKDTLSDALDEYPSR